MKKYDTAVVIGRFQPVHKGHLELIRHAAALAQTVVICIGSANAPFTPRNPWSAKERQRMLVHHIAAANYPEHFEFVYIDDSLYNDQAWINQVAWRTGPWTNGRKTCLVGFEKDATSYYLRYFPDWRLEGPTGLDPYDATTIREDFYKTYELQATPGPVQKDVMFGMCPGLPDDSLLWDPVERLQESLLAVQQEWSFNKGYDPSKYPIIVTTVDAVVVCNGHVLVVKRKHIPGKGLWALPGGHLNRHERLFDACLRELKEETEIGVGLHVLRNKFRRYEIFDHPQRSERARVITTAFLFHFDDFMSLPAVSGADDAAEAAWLPLTELNKRQFFDDHADIIWRMTNGL